MLFRNDVQCMTKGYRKPDEKDEDSMISFVMESLASVDGRGIQGQRYADRS
jgi:hypothetical protein